MAIAIDLDGTLAHYDGWKGLEHIGDPIPKMLSFVKELLAIGEEVVIFTARADDPMAVVFIEMWLDKHYLPRLDITNIKRKSFEKIYDDRAIQVIKNKGVMVHG